MKYQVTASEYAELAEEIQKLYYGDDKDGNRTIKIAGMPDYAAQEKRITDMDGKLAELLTETKAAKSDKRKAEKAAEEAANKAAQESGDVEAINKSWQTKYDTLESSLTGERDLANSALNKATSHSTAVELAATLAVKGSSDVLLPHIMPRLTTEIVDGSAVVKVLGKDGKPSALTVKELGEEIAGNAAFAPLIEASRAAGGGANGTQSGGAAATKSVTKAVFDTWNPGEKSKFSVEGGTIID